MSTNKEYRQIGNRRYLVPNEEQCKKDIDKLNHSIMGFTVTVKKRFYDFESAKQFRDRVGGNLLCQMIDTREPIYGDKNDAISEYKNVKRTASKMPVNTGLDKVNYIRYNNNNKKLKGV